MARISDKNVIATMLTLTRETRYTFDGKILHKLHGGTWSIAGKRKSDISLEEWRTRVIAICKLRDEAGLTLFATRFKAVFGDDCSRANEALKTSGDVDGVRADLNEHRYRSLYSLDDIKAGLDAREGYLQMIRDSKAATDALHASFATQPALA